MFQLWCILFVCIFTCISCENFITEERVCYKCDDGFDVCRKVSEDMNKVICKNNCQIILKSENQHFSIERGCAVSCPIGPGIKCINYTCDKSHCNDEEYRIEEISLILDGLSVKVDTSALKQRRADSPNVVIRDIRDNDGRNRQGIPTFPAITMDVTGLTIPTIPDYPGKGRQDSIYGRFNFLKILLLEIIMIAKLIM